MSLFSKYFYHISLKEMFLISSAVLFCLSFITLSHAEVVAQNDTAAKTPLYQLEFTDLRMRACVLELAGEVGAPVYAEDVEELFCQAKGIVELDGIESLVSLREFRAIYNNIKDIAPTFGLKKLEILDLEDNRIRAVDGIGALKKLEILNLGGNPLRSVAPIAELPKLKEAWLYEARIKDISSLGNIKTLEILDLNFNQIREIGDLSRLKNLEQLHLFRALQSGVDTDVLIEPIAQLTTLKRITLGDNNLTDLSPLDNLNKLETIDAGFNLISDTSFLIGKENLKTLYLDGNKVTRMDHLTGLVSLENLHLQTNRIETIPDDVIDAFQSNLTALGWMNISGNPIRDCEDVYQLEAALPDVTIVIPEHCK